MPLSRLAGIFSAGRVPGELEGRTLILGTGPDLQTAEALLETLETRYGRLTLGVVGETPYPGNRPHVAMPRNHDADRKRLGRLKPPRLIVLGEADHRFTLVASGPADRIWLNARSAEVSGTGCRLVTVSDKDTARLLPEARLTGDPTASLDVLPDHSEGGEDLCQRFKEYREREHRVFYVPDTGPGEEAVAFGVLFELLRRQTAIMILAPRDPARHEPVYRDAIKYSLPIIRHNRLMTSFVPRKNRIYYVEDMHTRNALFPCADLVIPGGSLVEGAETPDLVTPLLNARPILLGPHGADTPLARAAIEAGVVGRALGVDSLAARAEALLSEPEQTRAQARKGQDWLQGQVGAMERVMKLLD
ncbi:MAG TPA: 3-deoxy-D-manno-octulosonic acid transferase [Thioalkalivibrio sp.]|nr:3-deoxy-D-manno-octulosonic acid transferase [Thioalkalivibrio sp.]